MKLSPNKTHKDSTCKIFDCFTHKSVEEKKILCYKNIQIKTVKTNDNKKWFVNALTSINTSKLKATMTGLCLLLIIIEVHFPFFFGRLEISLKIVNKSWQDFKTEFLTNEPPRGKTNNVVSEQVRHKPGCTATEAG